MAHTWLPINYISAYAFAARLEMIREEIREDLELLWKQKPFNKAPKTRVLVPLAWSSSNKIGGKPVFGL